MLIKSVKFKVVLDEIEYEYAVELYESASFKYGNGTCVVLKSNDGARPVQFDTRYDTTLTEKTFRKWALKFIKQQLNQDCVISYK